MGVDQKKEATRRAVLTGSGGAVLMAAAAGATPASAAVPAAPAGGILPYLAPLQDAAAQLADTWRPDDPQYRAEFYEQIMMNLSWSYFAHFHADAEHPDWAPLWNCVYRDQPNPDDIYLYSPIRGDLVYRIRGDRGTTTLLTFTTNKGRHGLTDAPPSHLRDYDHRNINVGPNGEVDVILSAERPAGYTGDWLQIEREADSLVLRFRNGDWLNQRDPHLGIACLSPVGPKSRRAPEEIYRRIQEMAKLPARYNKTFLAIQNSVKADKGYNQFRFENYPSGLSKQVYWPAIFQLDDGEALIIETDMPKVRPYWNIQLNDPYFNAIEFVYRLSSTNPGFAKLSSDGKLRAVISLVDPGVPNWLDPGGFKEGGVYGRWYDCDSSPMPTIKRVPLADLRKHLPADTPVVSPAERAKELADRVYASQRRRRW